MDTAWKRYKISLNKREMKENGRKLTRVEEKEKEENQDGRRRLSDEEM